MIGAILRKEIRGSGRQGRYFAVRGAYLALLAFVTVPMVVKQAKVMALTPTFDASSFGQKFCLPFGLLQFALVALLAPAFSIGAIASERDTGGLDLLHVAGVRPSQVVIGKYASRMAWLVLFLLSGLPLFFAGTLMGGVGGETIALLMTHALIAAALGTALGMTLSGGLRHTVPALVLAYLGIAVVYLGAPMALAFWVKMTESQVPDAAWAWSSPFSAIWLFTDGTIPLSTAWHAAIPFAGLATVVALPAVRYARPEVVEPRDARRRAWKKIAAAFALFALLWLGAAALLLVRQQASLHFGGTIADVDWVPYLWASPVAALGLLVQGLASPAEALTSVGLHGAVALLVLLWFVGLLHRTAQAIASLGTATGGRNDPAAVAAAAWRPKIHGNPIAWRDSRSAGRSASARILRWVYVGLGALLAIASLLAAIGRHGDSNDFAKVAIVLLLLGGALVALIVGAGAISDERERKAMPLLRISRLSAFDVVAGKLAGLAVYLWPVAVLPTVVAAVFFWSDDAGSVVLTVLTTLCVLFGALGFGLLFSAVARRTLVAAGSAISIAVLGTTVPLVVTELFGWRQFEDDVLGIFDPLLSIVNVVDGFGNPYRSDRFWLGVVGLFFLVAFGLGCITIAWSALTTKEEA